LELNPLVSIITDPERGQTYYGFNSGKFMLIPDSDSYIKEPKPCKECGTPIVTKVCNNCGEWN